jgi:hypothetical protein
MSNVSDFVHALSMSTNGIDIRSSTAKQIREHMHTKNNFLQKQNIVNAKSIRKFFESSDYESVLQESTKKTKVLKRLQKKLNEKRNK